MATTMSEFDDYDENLPRTLYIGNLDLAVTEELILALFNQIGAVKGCKIIHEGGSDPYCFVEFMEHSSAASALASMNKRLCFGKEMKVNWAASPANSHKMDTSKHFHIFVGDLSPEIETNALREAFVPFGEISDCRVVRDPQTFKSKGYGFVSFVKKNDAETAITSMNGQWLGSRAIRTNWATRKPPAPRATPDGMTPPAAAMTVKPLTFDEVYNQSSPSNCTVYCGGIAQGLSEEIIQKTFQPYGPIQEIRVFKDKGYAFVRFATKEAATHAIVSVHNTEVNGQLVKCSWGKEAGDPNNQQPVTPCLPSQYAYAGYPGNGTAAANQMGYWFPQTYPNLQGQFMQGYSYGNYGFNQGLGMQLGGWQVPNGQAAAAAAAAAAAVAQQQLAAVAANSHLNSNLNHTGAGGSPLAPSAAAAAALLAPSNHPLSAGYPQLQHQYQAQ